MAETYLWALDFPVEMAGDPGEEAGAEYGEDNVEDPGVGEFNVHCWYVAGGVFWGKG